MFEKFGAEEWQAVVMIAFSIIGAIGAILIGLAAWILKYIIDVEKNTSSTSATATAMAASLEAHRLENERDHEHIHNRIGDVETDVKDHTKTLVEHSLNFKSILGNGG